MEGNGKNSYNIDHRKMGHLAYRRTPIEKESPEEYGYERINYNLAESSVPDAVLGDLDLDLNSIVLSYADHLGNPSLRQSIASEGEGLSPDHVLITAGAVGSLFIIATSLLKPSDHVVLLHPNYVANLESPRAIGCKVDYLKLSFEDKFQLDLEKLEEMIKPNTRLVSLTYPHNPTGVSINESELNEIISLVESKGCYLVLDETYRDMSSKPLPLACTLSDLAISVSSFSKSYGLPGIRLGWLINRNDALMEKLLAAKELIFICNPIIDEEIATHFYINKKQQFLADIKTHVRTNYELLKKWMNNNEYLEWIDIPQNSCICFPRVKSSDIDMDKFYSTLKETYKTFVAPGNWFEVDKRHMRIGFGYPSKQELEGGLQCITKAIEDSVN
ncbi:MAG: aminotransferase class I/II-fold pyridoxal phosphate-dependent enzyme [Candidatus Hodarchaeales archaeon]|jgi:aspartate/methionine/tyrosine aminotransferase